MIIAFCGHRPDKLPDKETGYKIPNPTYIGICQAIEAALLKFKPEKVISGMALGIDQWAAFISYKLKIPFLAAIPFEGQEKAWPQESQLIYNKLRKLASEEVIVSEGGYTPAKMQIRNQWMTDHCDLLIGVWDGSKGGTGNCLAYAKSINKEIFIIDPKKL